MSAQAGVQAPPVASNAAGAPGGDSGLKTWERALIALACALFLASLFLYVTDYPLRRYLFDIEDEGSREAVAEVATLQGSLRRQLVGEAEFKPVGQAAPLYDDDVLVTGPETSATVQLEDGSVLELGPDTMVRLHFTSTLTLGGISRAATVDVVAGSVKPKEAPAGSRRMVAIRAAPRPVALPRLAVAPKPIAIPSPIAIATPSPSPLPVVDLNLVENVTLLTPAEGTQLALPARTTRLEATVMATWKAYPADRPVQVTLWKVETGVAMPGKPGLRGVRKTQVYRQVIKDRNGLGQAATILRAPGLYEWELHDYKGRPIVPPPPPKPKGKTAARTPPAPAMPKTRTTARFRLNPEFEGIDPLEPLIGGKLLSSSKLDGMPLTNFDITLRWKPLAGAKQYRVAVQTTPDPKVRPSEKIVAAPQFSFNKGQVFAGQFFYQIKAALPGGFVARSPLKPFVFSFMAPAPAVPPDKTFVNRQALEEESDSVLMTWEKTNFTDWYEIQIAVDPDFKKVYKQVKLKENFFIFKSPPTARYYWRLRSGSKQLTSPYSAAFEFTVQR